MKMLGECKAQSLSWATYVGKHTPESVVDPPRRAAASPDKQRQTAERKSAIRTSRPTHGGQLLYTWRPFTSALREVNHVGI